MRYISAVHNGHASFMMRIEGKIVAEFPRILSIALVASMAIVPVANAQECDAGCVPVSLLEPECIPDLPDVCPLQAFGGTPFGGNPVSWLNDNGTWMSIGPANSWQAEPYSVQSPYAANNFTYPMIAEGASQSSYNEWACAIQTDGNLSCWGYDTIINHPTGEGPYSALSSGYTGRYGVLNASGQIKVWGNVAGGFGTPPTTTGFTELGISRDTGCAVGPSISGVSCWGSNTAATTNIVNFRPTTGTYTAVEVTNGIGMAVQDDGTLDIWCDTSNSSCQEFIANGPVAGQRGLPAGLKVVSVESHDTGNLCAAAMMEDGSAYLWSTSNNTSPTCLHSVGWNEYGVPSQRYFIPHGPDGTVKWRSRIEMAAANPGRMCGVIDDPAGTFDDSSSFVEYQFGELVCWGGQYAPPWPPRYASCVPQSW